MSQIINRLTLSNFSNGWDVYLKINTPYWVRLAFIIGIFSFTVFIEWVGVLTNLQEKMIGIFKIPLLINIVMGGIIFCLGWPFIRKIESWIKKRLESDFYSSQFGIFNSLERFNKGLVGLTSAFFMLLLSRQTVVSENSTWIYILIFLCFVLMFSVVGILVSLYGWLKDQFEEIH